MKDTAEYRRRIRSTKLLSLLIVIDISLALGIVYCWSLIAPHLTEPVGWATGQTLPSRPELFDTPTALVWLIPLISGSTAWLACNLKLFQLARLLAAFPLLFMGLVEIWFLYAPLAWR